MNRTLVFVAALLGLAAVVLGAFGAHGLEGKIEPDKLEAYRTGVAYHFYHVLAMLAAGWVASHRRGAIALAAGWCFAAGIVMFSGSIYLLATTAMQWLWPVTPAGGLVLMLGWLVLAVAALRGRRGGSGCGSGVSPDESRQ